MSGMKVDLDQALSANNFSKASIVIKDLDLEDIINEKDQPVPEIGTPPTSNQESPRLEFQLQETNLDAELSPPEPVEIAAPVPVTDPKKIADAIRSTIKSERSEKRASELYQSSKKENSIPYIKPSSEKPPHIRTPAMSEQTKKEEEKRKEEEEFDMMPQTDSEKNTFWLTKLQTLKMRFKDVTIPDGAKKLNWRELRKIYYMQLDRVSIGKNVDSYMLVLIVLFFITEWIVQNVFRVKMIKGFAVHSIVTMRRYHRLLIELGERDYSSIGENWPVEVRLGCLVIVNAIIFVIAKVLYQHTGQDHSDEFFKLYNNLGLQTEELGDVASPSGAGMTPAEGDAGGGGIMSMLGNLAGLFGGNGGGGGAGAGGLSSLFSMFTGAAGGAAAAANTGGTTAETPMGEDGEPNRVPVPTLRRKKKKKRSVSMDNTEEESENKKTEI